MLESFKHPPAEYRVTPFWFWNSALDEQEVERQIREMHSKGVGGFFIHGRFGLRTEYMGEDWMRCIEHACSVAQELDMHVWLYDENPFPSGVAGGEAMKNVQHFNKFLDTARHPVSPGETVTIDIPEGELLAVIAVNSHGIDTADLTPLVQDRRLTWTSGSESSEILIFVAATARYKGFIYGSEPDYFEKSLVDTFFAYTHERYADRLKPFFGSVIKGIFTDEPKIQCIHHMHEDAHTTAWFADILEQFKADHGYDLKPHLPCLIIDRGHTTGKVRRDFWTTVTNQYVSRFFERYRAWCEENDIALTGHLFLEEGLYANTMYQGNFPQVLRQFHVPGVDHLALTTEGDYKIGNVPRSITRTHGQKLVSSTAHANRVRRVLSETFGCCGWTLSLEHMKWIVDWQMSLGINFLCPHAFYYSLAGVRKTDAPPSQFYQATYWPHYRLFADYTARLSYVLSQGKHRAQIALLYPIKGFHSEWAPGSPGPLDTLIAECFDTYCAYLLKEHIDYDILTEEAIAEATVYDQQIRIADEGYDLLILPPTTAIGYSAAARIREFIEDGGQVIATTLLPVEDAAGDRHDEVRQVFASLFGRDPLQMRASVLSRSLPTEPAISSTVDGAFLCEVASAADMIPHLREWVSNAIKPEISAKWNGSECHDITYVHRITEDADYYFFSNNSAEPREVQLSVRCDKAPYMLDLETGSIFALPNCTQRGSRTILLHRFERYGSLMMCFSNQPALAIGRQLTSAEGKEVVFGREWDFRAEQMNSITLRDWALNILTQQDHMRYEYTTTFEARHVPTDLTLVLDDMPEVGADAGCAGSNCRVYVNGVEATVRRPRVVDVGFQSLDVHALAQTGPNELRIVIEHGGWSGDPQLMLAEPRLMGTFALESQGARLVAPPARLSTGSWTEQGYPFYSGTGVYAQDITIPDFDRSQRITLRADAPADMVEFMVNGASAGTRAWAPFELDISHLVKPGRNRVEIKVTNSLANTLLSEPRPSGLLGGARVVVW